MSAWTFLTLGVLARCAASCLKAILCPSVLVSEAPTFGDLVGTRFNSFLCSWGLSFPFCKRGFRRTGEHLVLQAGLPTAHSKQRQRKCYWTAYAAQLFLSNSKHHNPISPLICLIQHWIEQILPLQKCKIGNVLQKKEPCPQTSIVEHTVGQPSSTKLRACMRGKQSDNTHLKRNSRDLTLCKKIKASTTVPNKSTSYCTLCLTHSSWSKEKALYC